MRELQKVFQERDPHSQPRHRCCCLRFIKYYQILLLYIFTFPVSRTEYIVTHIFLCLSVCVCVFVQVYLFVMYLLQQRDPIVKKFVSSHCSHNIAIIISIVIRIAPKIFLTNVSAHPQTKER